MTAVANPESAADRAVRKFLGRNPAATAVHNDDSSWTVSVPAVALPRGWSKGKTAVKFIVPSGFPAVRPDCFWADVDLRLETGGMPGNSGNSNPFIDMLWFSYHPQQWDLRDTVDTYLHLIGTRFEQVR